MENYKVICYNKIDHVALFMWCLIVEKYCERAPFCTKCLFMSNDEYRIHLMYKINSPSRYFSATQHRDGIIFLATLYSPDFGGIATPKPKENFIPMISVPLPQKFKFYIIQIYHILFLFSLLTSTQSLMLLLILR